MSWKTVFAVVLVGLLAFGAVVQAHAMTGAARMSTTYGGGMHASMMGSDGMGCAMQQGGFESHDEMHAQMHGTSGSASHDEMHGGAPGASHAEMHGSGGHEDGSCCHDMDDPVEAAKCPHNAGGKVEPNSCGTH